MVGRGSRRAANYQPRFFFSRLPRAQKERVSPAMDSIGVVELSSIVTGYRVQDVMMKAASVEVIIARTICSGKYLIIVGGNVSGVESAVAAGLKYGEDAVIDHLVLARVHPSVFAAVGQSVDVDPASTSALGMIETFGATAALAAADIAAKAASVKLLRIHLAMALGGKGMVMMTGTIADVEAAVAAGAEDARQRGLLVNSVALARPDRSLLVENL